MKYLKLFIPIPITILIDILSENYFEGPNPYVAVVLKAGLFIYYLRLDNTRTPLINTLTLILLSMGLGEYFLQTNTTVGQIILVCSVIAFGIVYAIRQRLKDKKDKLIKLKITAVFVFVLTNITAVELQASLVPVVIGTLFIMAVYFYDRLVTISDSKKMGA